MLDYGSGNVHSALKAIEHAGAEVVLTADRRAVLEADGLLVPGVGAFGAVMSALVEAGGGDLIDRRLAGGRPVLGICVGMQVMFERGVERGVETDGLGAWPGTVEKMEAEVLPHMGWNTVEAPAGSVLFDGVGGERFYFVHSYAATAWVRDSQRPYVDPQLTFAQHGTRFLAAVEDGALSATQFHPEKSGAAGIRLLGNWIGSFASS